MSAQQSQETAQFLPHKLCLTNIMKTVVTCLNVLSIVAFVTALVTAVMSISYLESEAGMVPVTMLLTLAFWSMPALIVAVAAFVASMVITAREAAKSAEMAAPQADPPAPGLIHGCGQGLVLAGVAYVAWAMATRVKLLSSMTEIWADGNDPMLFVFVAISIMASAIPGLLVCLVGYWLMRPARAFDDLHAPA